MHALTALCGGQERLGAEEDQRAASQPRAARRYVTVARAAVRERFESDSAPRRALEVGEEITVIESRVNARGQTRVRFAAGWTSVTSADGATLLEPIDAVESDPQLYRVLNRLTIRVGADTVRRAPHGARPAHAPHARVSQASSQVGALEVGEFVTVLETRTLPNGQLRARFQYTLQKTRLGRDGGWTSVTTSDGERMMGAACPQLAASLVAAHAVPCALCAECIQDRTASLPEGVPSRGTSAEPPVPELKVGPRPEPEPEPKAEPRPEPEPEPEPMVEPEPEPEPEPESIGASDDSEWSSTDCSSTDSDASDGSDSASDDSEEDDLGELPGPSHTIDRQEIAARGGGRRRNSVSAESTSDMMRSQRALLTKLPKTEAETQRIAAAIAGNRARANCST